MKNKTLSKVLRSSILLLAVFSMAQDAGAHGRQGAQTMGAPQAAQPAAAQTSPQAPSICGSQPLCYETPDFAATITDFRTSTQGYTKVIDVVARFQNKTNTFMGLGYTQGSGMAMDDRGNRYIVYGANGTRGIGNVTGNNFDPKFILRPGGYGDARFELMWNPPAQSIIGSTFELDLTVREIYTVEGNQHTLGGEFPLVYKGLTNGVSANAPGMTAPAMNTNAPSGMPAMASSTGNAPGMPAGVAGMLAGANGTVAGGGAPVCGAASTATALAGATNSAAAQNAAATANSAVSSAAAALSSLGSIFGKKKAAAAPAANAAAAVSCVPATAGIPPSAATPASVMNAVTGAAPQAAGAAPAAATLAAATASGAKASASSTTAPAASSAKVPAKPAAKKAAALSEPKKTAETPDSPKPPQR